MGLFTRPRVDVSVNADKVAVRGFGPPSGFKPTFHVIRRAARVAGQAPWVIVGGPGFEPTQPPDYVLNVFRRDEWPSDAVSMWGDYVALLFAILLPRASAFSWRRAAVHVDVEGQVAQNDRDEFETRARDALVGCGAASVNFQWSSRPRSNEEL